MSHTRLTVERARQVFSYEPETGYFVRLESRANQIAGARTQGWSDGAYLSLTIDYEKVKAHILAWALMTGVWPEHQIDHKNRNKCDNRWINLRSASKSQNIINTDVRSNNTSGHCGVSLDKKTGRWAAYINKNKSRRFLGYYINKEDAIRERRFAARAYYGEFVP